MITNVRAWLASMGGSAAGVAGFICLTTPNAAAEPMPSPVPAPVTVTQTVTVAPMASAPVATPHIAAPITPAPVAGTPAVPVPVATPAPAATPALVPATSGTLRDYLISKNVTFEPQRSPGFSALNIALPMPPSWSQVPDPNVPDAFAVIANRASADLYTPNAQLVVYKLVGDFDPKEAITHGFIDSQSLMAWQTSAASLADLNGFPSSLIEGTYRQNDMTLNTSRRHVIATSGPDRYLVSLAVTSLANRQGAPSSADATDAIVNGFRVTPATAPATPPPTP